MGAMWQIHYQSLTDPDGPTELCDQRELEDEEGMRQFVRDVQQSHPLLPGMAYLIVPEDSHRFKRKSDDS